MILKPSEINASKITRARDALLEVLVISSPLYLKISFQGFKNLYYLYLHRYLAILKHSYFYSSTVVPDLFLKSVPIHIILVKSWHALCSVL